MFIGAVYQNKFMSSRTFYTRTYPNMRYNNTHIHTFRIIPTYTNILCRYADSHTHDLTKKHIQTQKHTTELKILNKESRIGGMF